MLDKVYKLGSDYLNAVSSFRGQGSSIVFTNGCFDILHAGHVSYLHECKKQGDILIVGLNSDVSVRNIKGQGRPIQSQEDRSLILAALSSVDMVVLFSEPTPLVLIQKILPDILIKGGDYNVDDIVGKSIVKGNGGKVMTIPFLEGRSTSDIVAKIKQSDI